MHLGARADRLLCMVYGLWTIDYRLSTAFLTSFAQASALGAGPKTRALQLTANPTHCACTA